MTSPVSAERLAELVAQYDRWCTTGIVSGGLRDEYLELFHALRELQSLREAMCGIEAGTHQIVPVEPTSEWLRDMGIERDDWLRYLDDWLAAAPQGD